MSEPDSLILPAPAKLNLFLHVTGRRDDGYHTLETLLVLIDCGDRVRLSRRRDAMVIRGHGAVEVAAHEDIVVRAARLVQRAFRPREGVGIDVEKRIPVGGGLGGGSSDAATVLLGLNRMWDLRLSRQELMKVAVELGADVPFFIGGTPALARGIGEELHPVSVPPTWFVVLTPSQPAATAAMFAAPELTRNSRSEKIQVYSEGYGRNDLQAVAVARFPEIAACLDALSREAPGAALTAMSGSGSCVFAAFPGEEIAMQVFAGVARTGRAGFVARALNHHPLRHFAAP
jgi:4-diphosphocytidyl-2-C-methyl-D-erythritol kinase